MREADQRTEVGRLLLRIPQANALHTLQQLGLERCFQARRDEHPGAVGAHLAGTEEVGHDRDIGCAIQIGILANDQRRLAAQLHGHVLQRRACRAGHDLLARRYATGERHFGDAWVFGDQRPDTGTTAGQHVEHAIGQPGLAEDFRQFERAQRGDFAGFEDHRVAGGQRRSRLPQGDLDRIVPGADAGDHAKRLPSGVDEAAVAQRNLLTLDGRGEARVVLQHVGAGNDVDAAGFAQRLAGIQGFQQRQLVVALAQQIDRAAHDARPLDACERRPDALALLGAFDRALQVGRTGLSHIGQDFAVGRVDALEGLVAAGVDVAAMDIELLPWKTGHVLAPVIEATADRRCRDVNGASGDRPDACGQGVGVAPGLGMPLSPPPFSRCRCRKCMWCS